VLRDLALIGLFNHDTAHDDLVLERDRASDRYMASYPARLVITHDRKRVPMSARLVNLSAGGAALRVYGHVVTGDQALLVIDVGRSPVDAPVRVVWTRHLPTGRMVGVAFETLIPDAHAAIAQLLDGPGAGQRT